MEKITVETFKRNLNPSASLGYQVLFITQDSNVICYGCSCDNKELIIEAINDSRLNMSEMQQWEVVAITGHSEGDAIPCSNCGIEIESDYGAINQG